MSRVQSKDLCLITHKRLRDLLHVSMDIRHVLDPLLYVTCTVVTETAPDLLGGKKGQKPAVRVILPREANRQ